MDESRLLCLPSVDDHRVASHVDAPSGGGGGTAVNDDRKPMVLRAERQVLRLLGALPERVQRRLAGAPVRIDGQQLRPEVQVALRLMKVAAGKTFEQLPLAEGRAQISAEAWVFGDEPPVDSVAEITIPGADGTMIPGRVYRPSGLPDNAAILVYFHGGGWVLGGLDAADSACRVLANHAGIAVLSVDYRLAPEHPFPAAIDDALAAFRHVVADAADLRIDPSRIAVGGESAGGNIAAVLARIATVDPNVGSPPAFQLLFMPVTDLSKKHRSYELFADGFFLTDAQMDWYKARYLGDPAQAADPRVSPLLAEDLSGLPPAYIVTAGFDPLRDEGEAYARRLADAHVPTAHRRLDGCIHGIVNATGASAAARDALVEAAGALRVGLAPR